jgi:hypothetical protein
VLTGAPPGPGAESHSMHSAGSVQEVNLLLGPSSRLPTGYHEAPEEVGGGRPWPGSDRGW